MKNMRKAMIILDRKSSLSKWNMFTVHISLFDSEN